MNDTAEAALRVRVPGKVFVLGEYHVLDPGGHALVAAVDRTVVVTVGPSPSAGRIVLDCPDLGVEGLEGELGRAAPRWGKNLDAAGFRRVRFVHTALWLSLWMAERAGAAVLPFRMRVASELGAGAAKPGLGGSAATVAGVVAGVLAWAGLEPTAGLMRLGTFKAAALAHFMAQEKRGSGADVAAAVHGGLTLYRNPDLGELMRSVDAASGMPGLVARFWELLRVDPVLWPRGRVLVVGSSGRGASTVEIVKRLEALQGDADRRYQTLRDELGRVLHDAVAGGTEDALGAGMAAHQQALARFDRDLGGLGIVTAGTAELVAIAERLGLPAKIAGAGGGDSVVALVPVDRAAELAGAWAERGYGSFEVAHPVDGLAVAS